MTQPYDVFISFKHSDAAGNPTRDSQLALEVHEYLASRGLKVFLSSVSLEALGEDAYKRAIDNALDSAQVLVAVGTSGANLDAKWVRYEWDSFFTDTLSGHGKGGRLFVYLESITVAELPRTLRQSQAFWHSPDSLVSLYNFIAGSLTTSVVDWLTQSQPEIDTLNRQPKNTSSAAIDQTLGAATAIAYSCIVRSWNANELTIDAAALKTRVESEAQTTFTASQWAELSRFLMRQGATTRTLGALLETPRKAKWAINYPVLAELWTTGFAEIVQSLFGITLPLREPQEAKEIAWCQWLSTLTLEPTTKTATLDAGSANPDDVFPPIERERFERDFNTLSTLPSQFRGELSSHLADRLQQYRSALFKIKDSPGSALANLYIAVTFYWELVRVATAGADEDRRRAASVQYRRDDGSMAVGYVSIMNHFLGRYLRDPQADHSHPMTRPLLDVIQTATKLKGDEPNVTSK